MPTMPPPTAEAPPPTGTAPRIPPPAPILQVLHEGPVRDHGLGPVVAAEQVGRWVVHSDHVVRHAADLDASGHRVPLAEQVLRELRVDDGDVAVRGVLDVGERATRVDDPALDVRPLGVAAADV